MRLWLPSRPLRTSVAGWSAIQFSGAFQADHWTHRTRPPDSTNTVNTVNNNPANKTDEVSGAWAGGYVQLQHHHDVPTVSGFSVHHQAQLHWQSRDRWEDIPSPNGSGDPLNVIDPSGRNGLQARLQQTWQMRAWRPGHLLRPAIGWEYRSAVLGRAIESRDFSLSPSQDSVHTASTAELISSRAFSLAPWPMPEPLAEAWFLNTALSSSWYQLKQWTVYLDSSMRWQWQPHDQQLDESVADIDLSIASPWLRANAQWQWRRHLGQAIDAFAEWSPTSWLRLEARASQFNQRWQIQPRISVDSGRYIVSSQWRWDELVASEDPRRRWTGFDISLHRRLVDGIVGLSYQWQRDRNGDWLDQRLSLSLSLSQQIVP